MYTHTYNFNVTFTAPSYITIIPYTLYSFDMIWIKNEHFTFFEFVEEERHKSNIRMKGDLKSDSFLKNVPEVKTRNISQTFYVVVLNKHHI